MGLNSDVTLTLWTQDIQLARSADRAGVNRIGLDLERLGKHARQASLKNAWISDHQEENLCVIRQVLTQAKLFVRTNPIHPGSRQEIDRLCRKGAQVLMLPMFTTVQEAAKFINFVDGRAEVSLLVEHIDAVNIIDQLVKLDGVHEICLGLNDLSLSLNLPSRFLPLTLPIVEKVAATVQAAGIAFGFGGLGRVDDRSLPISPDLIYAQYARLRATTVLISRVFVRSQAPALHIASDVASLRARLHYWYEAPTAEIADAHAKLAGMIS
ncbi:aldolase [Phormidium tenue FACHB-886]|nr:aldolase [Phormidium tenue FACHB-886]